MWTCFLNRVNRTTPQQKCCVGGITGCPRISLGKYDAKCFHVGCMGGMLDKRHVRERCDHKDCVSV